MINLAFQSLYDIFQQVISPFQPHRKANGFLTDVHIPALLLGKQTVDCACRMDS